MTDYEKDQFYRANKWNIRTIKRGTDYETAEVVKCLGFPNEKIIARAMWPSYALEICEEHNKALALALFEQEIEKGEK